LEIRDVCLVRVTRETGIYERNLFAYALKLKRYGILRFLVENNYVCLRNVTKKAPSESDSEIKSHSKSRSPLKFKKQTTHLEESDVHEFHYQINEMASPASSSMYIYGGDLMMASPLLQCLEDNEIDMFNLLWK